MKETSEGLSYFEISKMSEDEKEHYYLYLLAGLRCYSDALPTHKKVGIWHPDYPLMKCRRTIIWGIELTLSDLISLGVSHNPEIGKIVDGFCRYPFNYKSNDEQNRWTTRREIKYINRELDQAIKILERETGKGVDWKKVKEEHRKYLVERRGEWNRLHG